jgi:hypothetical protein
MKYKYEHIENKPEKDYNPKKIIKKEDHSMWKEKEFHLPNPNPKKIEKGALQLPQKVFDRTHTFEWDIFHLADYDFVNWANSMPETMLMAIMAEMKQSPKMKPSIEMLRQQVKDVPFTSIEEYSKKKRLGERSVNFLKEMKKRYKDNLLRVLYLTFD